MTQVAAGHDGSDRTRRAERRAVSVERAAAAAKQQLTAGVTTLDTGSGGMVTLDAAEIGDPTGTTPLGSATLMTGTTIIGSTPMGGDGGQLGGGHGATGGGRREESSRSGGTEQHGGGQEPPRDGNESGTGGQPASNSGSPETESRTAINVDLTGEAGGRDDRDPPQTPATRQQPPREFTTRDSRAESYVARQPIVVREKARALKLMKFKGLDDTMHVTMWLKTARAEVRRQAVTMNVSWSDEQLYHEVASHLDGEAKRWFATVMESVPRDEENIDTLAGMLRAKYMTQRTTPEVVDLLNARRQMRGERLVEYAQSLREIGERGDISESWLVNAFLKGMSSIEGATHVRGHRPQTLDEAVNLAVPHVGEYGEGYGVGLETAMRHWDDREARQGRGPLAAAGASLDQEQSGLHGNLENVVSGYGPMWGSAPKPPRYDTEGRPVSSKGVTGEWWSAIPPGFTLVPTGKQASSRTSSKIQTAGDEQAGTRGKRTSGNEQNAARPAKTFKVEAATGIGPQDGRFGRHVELGTREGRLRNYDRYQERTQAQRAQVASRQLVPRPGTECFYCGRAGHFARDCNVKKADLAARDAPAGQGAENEDGESAGNGSRA